LTRVLFEQAEDLLCSIIKLQRSFSRGVRTYHDEHPDEDTYVWSAPSGVTVRQKYMKDRRIRIKDVVGNTLHSYRVDTNTHNPAKSASAFPPNLVHSLDASILCKGIVQASTNHNINSFMAIHDCIGIHAAHASTMSSVLSSAYSDVIYSDEVKDLQRILLGGGLNCVTMGLPEQGNLDELSSYLFS
jgi:DNA-directed RNA polymerase